LILSQPSIHHFPAPPTGILHSVTTRRRLQSRSFSPEQNGRRRSQRYCRTAATFSSGSRHL
ncbi:hypothetical protein HispidOSU_000979, partial [Sigmodon hispidus]